MFSTSKNKIVRVKEIFNTNESVDRQYHNTYLTTLEDYIEKSNYITYGYTCEKYPYKWYQFQQIWTIPSYWILLKLFRNNISTITRKKHGVMSVIVFMTELLTVIKGVSSIFNG